MILIALALIATPEADQNRAVNEAVRAWGGCVGSRVAELAYRPDAPEVVAEAAATACASLLDSLNQASIALMGDEEAAGFIPRMRAGLVTSMTRRVVEIRTGTLDRGRPEAIHAACLRIQADSLAFRPAPPDRLADQAVASCAREEGAAIAAFHPETGEDTAMLTARLRNQSHAIVRQRIETLRAGR